MTGSSRSTGSSSSLRLQKDTLAISRTSFSIHRDCDSISWPNVVEGFMRLLKSPTNIPVCPTRWPKGGKSCHSDVLFLQEVKQFILRQVGMAFNLCQTTIVTCWGSYWWFLQNSEVFLTWLLEIGKVAMSRTRWIWAELKFDTPMALTLPSPTSSSKVWSAGQGHQDSILSTVQFAM